MGAAARPVRTKRPSRRAAEAAGGRIPSSASSTKRPTTHHQAVVADMEAAASHTCRAKRRRLPSSPCPKPKKKEALLRSHSLALDPCSNHRGEKRAGSKQELPGAKRARSTNLPCPPPADYNNNSGRDCANNLLDDNNNNIWRDLANSLLIDDAKRVLASRVDHPPCPPDTTDNNWRDWANLADGPAGIIAERVLAYDVADYVRYRAVCRPWRQSSTEPRTQSGLDRRFHPWRWTMLREEGAMPGQRCRFLNTSTGECVKVDIPELHDHELLALSPDGLLILVYDRKFIRLLNPLTRHLTELPPLTTLVPPKDHHNLLRNPYFNTYFAAWGSGVSDDGSTFVLCFNKLRMVGLAKPGDDHWKVLRYHSDGTRTAPVMIAGRFYCVTREAVMVLETDPNWPQLKEVAELDNMRISQMADSLHLVNNCGELMLVHRHCGPLTAGNQSGWWYDTYRADSDTSTLTPVKSLGGAGRALFMGSRCSLSVSLEVFPAGSISADTIYLSFDFTERNMLEVGGYHIADGSVELPCSLVPGPHTLVDCLSLANTVVDD